MIDKNQCYIIRLNIRNRKRGGQCARCRKTLDKEGHLSDSLRSLKRRHRKMSQRKVTLQPPRKRF